MFRIGEPALQAVPSSQLAAATVLVGQLQQDTGGLLAGVICAQ
jgi:hypothetical protein